jgi:hypothetical protein
MAASKEKATTAKAAVAKAARSQIQISYSKERKAWQIAVPPGVGLVAVAKAIARLDKEKVIPVPGGCLPCLSGHPFDIFEQFDPVVNVAIGR